MLRSIYPSTYISSLRAQQLTSTFEEHFKHFATLNFTPVSARPMLTNIPYLGTAPLT